MSDIRRSVGLLTEIESHRLLAEANTHFAYPKDQCVHQLFGLQAERTPDAIAVWGQGECVTYRELNDRAGRLASHLRSRGVGPEVLVGLCADRSPELIVGMLGILKAGGAYVPLDPAYPAARLAFMLRDAKVPVLLTQRRLAGRLPGERAETIYLDSPCWKDTTLVQLDPPSVHVTPNTLAYVIYTSGSTGMPKGVQIEHLGLLNLIFWHRRAFSVTPMDRATQLASPGFDAAVWEIWPYLTAGASLHIPDGETRASPECLRDWLVAQAITICFLPTPLAEPLLSLTWPTNLALRMLLTGGDQLRVYPPRSLPFALANNYGPTENSVVTTSGIVPPKEHATALPPIGRPIANTQVYVLDDHQRPVGAGNPGELHIGGDGLARGYLNRPDLTAERFIPNPFSDHAGARLYRTGDLARYLPDGNLEFLGRIDQQVKIRGHRVELGEIEIVLGQHPGVKEAVVIAREDAAGDKRLAAYFVARQDTTPSAIELRGFLKEKIPDYMVPIAFMPLAAFPLTPNGKVDRQALPIPELWETRDSFVAPRTLTEAELAGIWTEVLGLPTVGVHDNFFDLGGHSLATTLILSRVRNVYGVEVPFRDFFETPTIADLARMIEGGNASGPRPDSVIPCAPRDTALRLSFSQERVWFIQQLHPSSKAYNFQATLRLRGTFDVTLLERSLSEIIHRHEIYRTTFPAVDGRPVQVVHDATPVRLSVVDLQGFSDHEREEEAKRLAAEEFGKPFDLTQLPLIRWTLLRLSPQDHLLLHVEHHLVHDGWSFNVFLREVQELYRAFTAGKPSQLPELPIQFSDFAHWQRAWMQGEVAQAQLDYWRKKLGGCPPVLELPIDKARPPAQRYRGGQRRIDLSGHLCESLRTLSRQEGVTLFMTLLATFQVLLHRYTGQEDFCIGTGIANRRWPETEGLIGMIVNTVALRADLSGNPAFRELLERVRVTTLEAYAHQDLPFERIVEMLRPERSLSYSPLFQVMFSFHDAPMPDLELPGLTVDLVEGVNNGSAKFDLNVAIIPRAEQRLGTGSQGDARGITVVWEYSTDLFEEATITRMLGHYQRLLEGIVQDPGQWISRLPLLTEAERHQLLIEWNGTTTDYPRSECIHELFEAQTEKTPDATAVQLENDRLSYGELNRRANKVAHYLRTLGVGPETLVGICVERSLNMVIGVLGILKAGAAYVPLDLGYPRGRLSVMLADAQVPVLLTHERVLKRLPDYPGTVVCLDSDWDEIALESSENVITGTTAESLAYVMYTSGSTGLPKGVCVPHRGVVRLVKNTNYVRLSGDEVFLQFAPISFDASTFEIWGCLLNGGRLVIFPPHTPSLEELGRALQRHGITTLWLTAGMFHQMVEGHLDSLKSIRQLLAGGDVLSVPHARTALQELRECQLINGYGPTEGTTFTCCYSMRDPSQVSLTVPIGRPIANTTVYILDQYLQPAPIGVPGVLCIGGDGLARGYLNRPQLTAERFIPNPFNPEPGALLYRTGDWARYRADGVIEFLGRKDQQVKIRGFRIELGEIEATLGRHPSVREAVVLARSDEPGEKRLVAYVVPMELPGPPISELRSFLRERLPDYMLPLAFVTLEALPLTPNGKVDRNSLPAPARVRALEQNAFVAPRTPVEEVLAGLWAELLGIERVGIHDNFFELGGHSLVATQLISRIRNSLRVELPLRALFEQPTVAGLATMITASLSHRADENIERLLVELQGLSDEEVRKLLSKDADGRSDA